MAIARYILNETSYFGIGSRENLATEVKARGYKKALLVSDKILESCGVLDKVKKVLDDIEKFPEEDTYETIAGFMMYMLKSIPKKGAVVDFENYTFEVVDVDRFKIDQLLVTRKNSTENIN